jgi:hypothetical protein
MRPVKSLFAVFFLCACAAKPGADADAGAEGGASAASSGGPQVQGAGCGAESTTGQTLCTAISLCPTLAVDHDVYPNCGFRIRGQAIDLECACNGALCPIGAPATCDQAKQLLAGQTELQVCTQVNDGRCTTPTPQATSSASSSSGAASTCDRTCAGECGGDPGCVKLCGC